MSAWTAAYRKKCKASDTPRLEEEAETTYDIAQLTTITRNKHMWRDFDSIAKKAKHEGITPDEFKLCTAAIAVTLLFNSAQRPSAVTGMKIREFHNMCYREGMWVVSVVEYKMSATGAARLTITDKEAERIDCYMHHIRQQIDPRGNMSFWPLPLR